MEVDARLLRVLKILLFELLAPLPIPYDFNIHIVINLEPLFYLIYLNF